MKIEENVPMPQERRKYPFVKMEVGESVFFDGVSTGGKEYVASQMIARSKGWKFVGRAEGDGLRIWRTA